MNNPSPVTIRITRSTPEGSARNLWTGQYVPAQERERDGFASIQYTEPGKAILLDQSGEILRELSAKELDAAKNQGEVQTIHHTHPRACLHGQPLCAIPNREIWMATCGKLGFHPSRQLQITCEDTGDDRPPTFRLGTKIPMELQTSMELRTKKMWEVLGGRPLNELELEDWHPELKALARTSQFSLHTLTLAGVPTENIRQQIQSLESALDTVTEGTPPYHGFWIGKKRGFDPDLRKDLEKKIQHLQQFLSARKTIEA